MRFRKMSVAGTAWLHDPDVEAEAARKTLRQAGIPKKPSKGKKPVRRGTSLSMTTPKQRKIDSPTAEAFQASPVGRKSSIGSHWKSSARPNASQPGLRTATLLSYIQNRPNSLFARKARFFLLSIALCHTCLPEKGKGGEIDYQAASPDEIALVRAAQELGFLVVDRQSGTITIRTHAISGDSEFQFDVYQVLDVIEFSSNRKRMSIIVRMPDDRICLFCKGADSTIIQLLRLSSLAEDQAFKVQSRVAKRQSLEAQQAIRRDSENRRKDSMTRTSVSIHRPSVAIKRLQPIKDELDEWLKGRENDVEFSPNDDESIYYSPRPSAHIGTRHVNTSIDGRPSFQADIESEDFAEDALVINDAAVFERCFQHTNDFATEGLRTLLYAYKYVDEDDYKKWKKAYLEASTSLVDRPRRVEEAGAAMERDLELAGATAIEDKLQKGVPETIDKLRRGNIRLWVLTGDKRGKGHRDLFLPSCPI